MRNDHKFDHEELCITNCHNRKSKICMGQLIKKAQKASLNNYYAFFLDLWCIHIYFVGKA